METWLIVLLIVLGIALLFFGKRLWLLGAGIGALLGVGLVRLIPGLGSGWLGVLIILGLAVTVGVLAIIFKASTHLIAYGLGFLAGGAITIAIVDMFSLSSGVWSFLLAVGGGLIGAVLANRFFDWVILIFAGLIGALLVMRGLDLLVSGGLSDTLTSLGVLVLAGLSIFYQWRKK